MFHYVIAMASATTPQTFQDLETLDDLVSLVDAGAQPLDPRLKLAVCPEDPIITPVNGSIVVRCEAKGWRLRVPVKPEGQSHSAAQILVRKGERVECLDVGQGFSVSTSMIALEDGTLGQAIRVKSPTSSGAVTATVKARGTVTF